MKSASLGSPVRREKKKVKAQTVVLASSGKSRGSRYQQSKSSPISKANSALPSAFKKRNAPRIAKFYGAPTKREGHRFYLALRLDNNTRITPTGYDESSLSIRNLSTCTHQ